MKKSAPVRRLFCAVLFCAAPLCLLLCTACGHKGEDLPPPDITGIWLQDGWENSNYYQFAIIDPEEILVYWYTPADKSRDLHWAGTYVPPVNGRLPYKWDSQTRRDEHKDANRFTLVDDTKTFIFRQEKKEDKLVFDVMMSHMKMGMSMSRVEDYEAMVEAGALPRFDALENTADIKAGRPPRNADQSASPPQNAPAVQAAPGEAREFSLTPGEPPDITIIPGNSPDAPPFSYTPPEAPPNQLP